MTPNWFGLLHRRLRRTIRGSFPAFVNLVLFIQGSQNRTAMSRVSVIGPVFNFDANFMWMRSRMGGPFGRSSFKEWVTMVIA